MAELFELVDQSAGAVFGGAAALHPVGAEVGVVDLVVNHVAVGDQQIMASARWVFFVRAAACAASVSAVRSATEPCRVRPDRLRPPEVLLAGQIPAQLAKCAGVRTSPYPAALPTTQHRPPPASICRASSSTAIHC